MYAACISNTVLHASQLTNIVTASLADRFDLSRPPRPRAEGPSRTDSFLKSSCHVSPLAPLGSDRYFVNFQISSFCLDSVFEERQQSLPHPPLLLSSLVLLKRHQSSGRLSITMPLCFCPLLSLCHSVSVLFCPRRSPYFGGGQFPSGLGGLTCICRMFLHGSLSLNIS